MPVAADVRRMFGAIAPRYDLLNRLLSLGVDQGWRRRASRELEARPGDLACDLCCGTGDLSLALAARGARVVGADFSREMLARASGKGVSLLAEADAQRLPFRDRSFDLLSVAFGLRNLADRDEGLAEMRRVLRPGGRLGILEFASPPGALFRTAYLWYLRHVVPLLGALVSGRASAYRYLADSIRAFPDQARMKEILREAGFVHVRHVDLALGIAALYVARVPGEAEDPLTPPSGGP